jgi:histidine phosphotransfer protein HptB
MAFAGTAMRDQDGQDTHGTMRQELPSAAQAGVRSAEAATPALEPGAFDALVREIGEDGASEVRDVFWTETRARLRLFRELTITSHCARIERESHSLKSAAGTFGYVRLAELALRLEKSATGLGGTDYQILLDEMDAAYAAALAQEPPR